VTAQVSELLALAARLPGEDARREAEILLCHALDKPRSYLYAFADAAVDADRAQRYREAIAERARGVPVAYLLGAREFWSLPLKVSAATLIPRADTERLVEVALQLPLPERARVVDLGTGSGAIALALAHERPAWAVTGVDASADALAVARDNGAALGLPARWLHGDWFTPLPGERFDLVAANPPYLDADDPHLAQGDLRFEPRAALVAAGEALAAIRRIVTGAGAHLAPRGWLLLEHGCEQGAAVRVLLAEAGFVGVRTWQDLAGRDRVSGGQWAGAADAAPRGVGPDHAD
jgi:release factor glutamine methyltransferase